MLQEQAQQLFEAGGFFILPLDRQGTEFGIDGSLWAVKQDSFAVSRARHSDSSTFTSKSIGRTRCGDSGARYHITLADIHALPLVICKLSSFCLGKLGVLPGHKIPTTWLSSLRILSASLSCGFRSRRSTGLRISYTLRRRDHDTTWIIPFLKA